VLLLVCHDEIVVEVDTEQVEEAKEWLESAIIKGMEAVLNDTDEVNVPVEIEARKARCWGEGG
jgi:DNA polymerase I-like protein with 3'-5' exonuclease and polymerase domains